MEKLQDRLMRIIGDYHYLHGKMPATLHLTKEEIDHLRPEDMEGSAAPTFMGIYLRVRE